jgi:hypothetical protein
MDIRGSFTKYQHMSTFDNMSSGRPRSKDDHHGPSFGLARSNFSGIGEHQCQYEVIQVMSNDKCIVS